MSGTPADPIERMLVEQLRRPTMPSAGFISGPPTPRRSMRPRLPRRGRPADERVPQEHPGAEELPDSGGRPTGDVHAEHRGGEQKIAVIGAEPAPGFRPALPDRDGEPEDTSERDENDVPLRIA